MYTLYSLWKIMPPPIMIWLTNLSTQWMGFRTTGKSSKTLSCWRVAVLVQRNVCWLWENHSWHLPKRRLWRKSTSSLLTLVLCLGMEDSRPHRKCRTEVSTVRETVIKKQDRHMEEQVCRQVPKMECQVGLVCAINRFLFLFLGCLFQGSSVR